jgi:hypothetical protein
MQLKILEKTKELLQKLLKKHLDSNLLNLELKNQKEFNTLLLINNSSKDIINNLSELSKNLTKSKKIKAQKIQLQINNISNSNKVKNKAQRKRNQKGEFCEEIDNISKNKKINNKKNIENQQLPTYIKNKDTFKTKVSFPDKASTGPERSNMTPNHIKKTKTFFNNTSYKKRKKFIKKALNCNNSTLEKKKNDKNERCETERKEHITSRKRNEKNKKLISILNHNVSFSTINNDNTSKSTKKAYKTMTNFYSKKNKGLFNNSVYEFQTKNEKKLIEKKEKDLNYLCDSLLIDVNKDELLVNNSKIMLNDKNELVLRRITNEDGGGGKNILYYEKLKASIQYIIDYLTMKDLLLLCQTKKEILKIVMNLKIKKTKRLCDNINILLKTKNININDSPLSQKLKPFELNLTSMKAITTLNSISKPNFLKSFTEHKSIDSNIINKLILIFDIYFIALGKKNVINNFNGNNTKKIEYICDYFKKNKNKSIGKIIQNDLTGIKFDDLIINALYEYSHKFINIINPEYYKHINKDIAIFVLLIKNILDYLGISNFDKNDIGINNKNSEQKINLINKSRLKINNILLEKYNQILKKFN